MTNMAQKAPRGVQFVSAIDPDLDPDAASAKPMEVCIMDSALMGLRGVQEWKLAAVVQAGQLLKDAAYVFRCKTRHGEGVSNGWCFCGPPTGLFDDEGDPIDPTQYLLVAFVSPKPNPILTDWRLAICDPSDNLRPADFDSGRFSNPHSPWTRKSAA